MLSRKPSLGFTLLCVSLLMAAAGAILGLGITYLHEVKSVKREINTRFSSTANGFAQRMTPAFLSRLERDDPKALVEVNTYLSTLNFTLTEYPAARVKIFSIDGKEGGPKNAFALESPDFEIDDETELSSMLLDVITTERALVRGFSGELEDIGAATNVLRSSFGNSNAKSMTLRAVFPTRVGDQRIFVATESLVSSKNLRFTSVLEIRHLLPLIGIVPLLISLIFHLYHLSSFLSLIFLISLVSHLSYLSSLLSRISLVSHLS
ncbi:MAG: hypothetical protein AAF357_16195, partial [Verrucomicrobiota bacterium]